MGSRCGAGCTHLLEGCAVRRRGQLVERRHDVRERDVPGLEEVRVAVRHDAHQLAAHQAILRDRDAGEAVLLLDGEHVLDGVLRREHLRVGDEAVLEVLHAVHLLALLLDRVVVVDEADAAVQSHLDRHLRLRHRVHRRADERHVQLDVARELGLGGHVIHAEVDVPRQQDDVAVRQRRPRRSGIVEQLGAGEPVVLLRLVLREQALDRLCGVERERLHLLRGLGLHMPARPPVGVSSAAPSPANTAPPASGWKWRPSEPPLAGGAGGARGLRGAGGAYGVAKLLPGDVGVMVAILAGSGGSTS